MFLRTLANQLIRDLKASRAKSAVLGILLLVGLALWLPPLFRWITGSPSSGPELAGQALTPPQRVAIRRDPLRRVKDPAAASRSKPKAESQRKKPSSELTWDNVDDLLASDPQLRSVEVAAFQNDPFRMDPDQFSPPILFAESPADNEPAHIAEKSAGQAALDKLVLKSTVVGTTQRAAFINAKLYFEGAEIQVNGAVYRLAAVYPRSVLLRQGGDEFELTIAQGSPSGRVEVHPELTDD